MLMLWCVAVIGACSGGLGLLLHLRQVTREEVRDEVRAELRHHIERVRQLRSVPKRTKEME